ncbi:enoyl-CoA hydratase/isomerase family protein [Xanthobacter sediminis]
MSAPLTVEIRGPVAHLTLDRPEVLNAIDAAVCDAIEDAFDRLEADESVRAVVVAGAGPRAFSAGADLAYMRTLEGPALRRFIERTWVVFERVAASPLPSVCALHGHVLGGGLELALACDLRVGEETASIGLPEMGLGSVPGSGALQRLPGIVGEAKAAEMVLLGRRLNGREAAELGLVNAVCAAGEACGKAEEWAQTIATRPREALRYAKLALRFGRQPAAAALHGFISDACHREKGYAANTDRFVGEAGSRRHA